jgi:DtxR family Mn-dependent transcriptional regulator
MKAFKQANDRAQLEDTLKHLWVFEQSKLDSTVLSVAGALECAREKAREILARLQEAGLVLAEGPLYALSDKGREYAIQILRAHRLYETFLANETGATGQDWHAEAERVEHKLTPEETNQLAKQLGHPRYDPHGDPIPTRYGQSPVLSGDPLDTLKIGEVGKIVRLNDNPESVFGRICEAGLAPNLEFEIVARQNQSTLLRIAGREIMCDPEMVDSLTVERLSKIEALPEDAVRLSDLKAGQSGEILKISPVCRGTERRRLLDLGFVNGGRIEVELAGIFKSPVAYKLRNTIVALRDHQTENIFVRTVANKKED